MSTSTGYTWRHPEQLTPPQFLRFGAKNLLKKRRHEHENGGENENGDDFQKAHLPRRHMAPGRAKRSKTPKILGLSLPVARAVEVLDHKSLQDLVQAVVAQHPEVAQTIAKIAPKPSLKDAVGLMKQKADDIVAHLPYKCDVESDYSYIRVKAYLTEFLTTLSDFILNILPPMELSLAHACCMLDAITCLIHDLPNFSNNEFQYTRASAYEQIASLWFIVLAHHSGDDGADPCDDHAVPNIEGLIEFAKTVEELDLIGKLERHNEMSHGKFTRVVEYVRAGLDAYESIRRSTESAGAIFNDLITVDYSNYFISARTSH